MIRAFILLAILSLAHTALAGEVTSAAPLANYRGDRCGYYANCTPPTTWNDQTGENIAWRTRMPNWGWGLPVVAGDRVLTMSEPGWKSDFPVLSCLDARTGKVLWEKEVNHLELAIPNPQERKEVADAWHSYLARFRIAYRFFYRSREAKTDEEHAKIMQEAKALKLVSATKEGKFCGGYQPGYGPLRSWNNDILPDDECALLKRVGAKNLHRTFGQYSLRLETFYGFGTAREGEAFSTPCTDGTSVYLVTEQGAHACFDLDGNMRWMSWIRPGFNKGGHDDSICSSPLLYDGLFITTLHMASPNADRTKHTNPIIALDAKTGKTVWQTTPTQGFNDGCCGSSKTLDLGGTRVLITNGGYVLRVKDGKELCLDISGKEMKSQTECSVDNASDTVFYSPAKGQGTHKLYVAKRLTLEGDTLTVTEAWRAPVGAGYTTAVHDGKVYTGANIIDIATGTVTKTPEVDFRWLLAVAGDKLYGGKVGTSESKGALQSFKRQGGSVNGDLATLNVLDLKTGKLLPGLRVLLMPMADTQEMIDQRIETTGGPAQPGKWNGKDSWKFSLSLPFTFAGDSLYVRSSDELICVRTGAKSAPRQ